MNVLFSRLAGAPVRQRKASGERRPLGNWDCREPQIRESLPLIFRLKVSSWSIKYALSQLCIWLSGNKQICMGTCRHLNCFPNLGCSVPSDWISVAKSFYVNVFAQLRVFFFSPLDERGQRKQSKRKFIVPSGEFLREYKESKQFIFIFYAWFWERNLPSVWWNHFSHFRQSHSNDI